MKTVFVAGFLLLQNIAVMFACDHYFKQITFSRPSFSLPCALFWIVKCRKDNSLSFVKQETSRLSQRIHYTKEEEEEEKLPLFTIHSYT